MTVTEAEAIRMLKYDTPESVISNIYGFFKQDIEQLLAEGKPKQMEPVYEWQWSVGYDDKEFVLSEHFTDKEAGELNYLVDKYEPSKRERR